MSNSQGTSTRNQSSGCTGSFWEPSIISPSGLIRLRSTSGLGTTDLQTAESIGEMYRDAWSRFATGVTVITTIEPGGAVHGMTASSVTSVSLDPPLVLVVIGEERQTHGLIESTGRFGMSILDSGQTDIAKHFATPPEVRGELDSQHIGKLAGSPVIKQAIAAMDCKVSAAYKVGDHTLFIGEVEAIQVGQGDPLVWFQRQFGGFTDQNSNHGSS
ncbi:MAG TPA: flavin reductase [Dehalococcoidia bacterium]|nr:flavin reductase [Dehalococcoidia bacterium]